MDQITMIDVLRAVTELVEARFPRYPVNNRDIVEGFPRPSAYVDISDITSEMISATLEQETAQVSVFFFEETIYTGFLRLMELKGPVVDCLLSPLPVTAEGGRTEYVLLDGVRALVSKADKALQVDFSVSLRTEHTPFNSDDDLPDMQALELQAAPADPVASGVSAPAAAPEGDGTADSMGSLAGGLSPACAAE